MSKELNWKLDIFSGPSIDGMLLINESNWNRLIRDMLDFGFLNDTWYTIIISDNHGYILKAKSDA